MCLPRALSSPRNLAPTPTLANPDGPPGALAPTPSHIRLPVRDGLVDWDCPEAISFPDLEQALIHIRSTGTYPVSAAPTTTTTTNNNNNNNTRLSHRSSHGCARPSVAASPSPPPTLLPQPPASFSPTSSLTTTHHGGHRGRRQQQQQPDVNSIEDQNTVGPCPVSPDRISACAAKVRHWLSPGQPGAQIFPPPGEYNNNNSNNGNNSQSPSPNPTQPSSSSSSPPPRPSPPLRLCFLDGFLLYAPTRAPSTPSATATATASPLARVASQLDVKLFLRTSRARAVQRRAARDGYVTLEGFWRDPPGYVERVVWPGYARAHAWLFEGGVVEGGRLDAGVLRREGIRALVVKKRRRRKGRRKGEEEKEERGVGGGRHSQRVGGEEGRGEGVKEEEEEEEEEVEEEDVEFGEVLEWAVDVVMRELERIVLGKGGD